MAERIVERGCLLAEVAPEQVVSPRLLLARDRLQAALSMAVVVVQAHARCGSLVTARHAIGCNRLLYGMVWERERFAQGWEQLAKMGARAIRGESDFDRVAEEMASRREADPQARLS